MAATGKTPILLYGSTTATNTPSAGNLTNSSDGCEIAINVADKNLFFKDSTNAVNTVPIRQSSASSNGWLSSTDWSTFNSKQPAGTYVTSVTGTSPVVSSGGTTPAISMAAATGSVNGYLTSTDWTTFNSKVSSQWVTSGSNIYYSTGNVGIGVSSPGQILDIGANDNTAKTIALRYSSVPSYYSSTYDGTSGLNTVSINAYNNSSGSASFSSAGNTAYGIGAVQVASFTTGSEVRFLTSSAANTTPVLAGTVDKSGNYKAVAGVYAAGASGFYSTTYVSNARNPVWRFGNADTYGISYFQGSSGTGSADTIGMHFGTATAAGSPFQFISNGNQVLSTGNLVIGTSGKGIDFSATSDGSGTATSELLADYEEGTWTATVTASSGTFTTITYGTNTYTKVGNIVTVTCRFTITTIGTASGTMNIAGLPYTASSAYDQKPFSCRRVNDGVTLFGQVSGTNLQSIATVAGATGIVAGNIYTVCAFYTV